MDTAATGQCKRRRERKGNFFVYFFLSSHFLKSWGGGKGPPHVRKERVRRAVWQKGAGQNFGSSSTTRYIYVVIPPPKKQYEVSELCSAAIQHTKTSYDISYVVDVR